MRRARTANQLAKSLHGRSRVRAYAVKTRAVLGLTVGFPDRIRIYIDFKTPGFLLVKAPTVYFGLHIPAVSLNRLNRALISGGNGDRDLNSLR